MTTAVKVCGVTTVDDALLAVELGARFLGLNFYPRSPRALDLAAARAIAEAVRAGGGLSVPWAPPGQGGVGLFGVFVDAEAATIATTVATVGLDGVQLHGDEPPALWSAVMAGREEAARRAEAAGTAGVAGVARSQAPPPAAGPPACALLRALRLPLGSGPRLAPSANELAPWETAAWGYLVEARHPALYGGTGAAWDYAALGALPTAHPVFLAGGIGPGTAGLAIRACRPYGVDVCSRVESAPGRKDPARLRALFAEVRDADGSRGG